MGFGAGEFWRTGSEAIFEAPAFVAGFDDLAVMGEPVLDDWCAPYSGLHLYYPVGQVTPALRALIDALKWKSSSP
jgi:hypothetical protein